MNHRKIFVMLVRRDECLIEALRTPTNSGVPGKVLGEMYLKAARRTAELADEIDKEEGRTDTLTASIQRDVADWLFEVGCTLTGNIKEAQDFRQANEKRLRDSLNEQIDRIDRGEEEMISFEEAVETITGKRDAGSSDDS